MDTKDAKVYEEYCRCRNQVKRLTRKAIKSQEKDIAKKTKTNSKVFWKFVNSKIKVRSTIPELYTTSKPDPNKITKNDHEKAEVLGKFFSSVYVKEPEWTWVLDDDDKAIIKEELKLDITKEIISKKLHELNINKSPGPDNMHPKVLKELASVLIDPLFIIFNISLRLGKIPSAWKLAAITAIFKNKGNKQSAGNYRPVSLTSIACKIMESIIRDSIMSYLNSNEILTNKQFGFLRGRSTVLQLLIIVDKWTEILDNDGVIDVLYGDFQKAFDTVPHNRLLELLSHYGINEPILSWVRDFLTDRKQQVVVNGCKSAILDVISGVPQGSVLGPLLFIIYINSMVEKAGSTELFLYADDLKIYNEIKSVEDAELLQQDLDRLYDWTRYSLLRFHPDKCVTMRIMSKTKKLDVKEYNNMDETKLKTVYREEGLGIIFDNKLSFEEHINSKVKKANSLAGMLRRSFEHLDKAMFKQLFTSIIRPHLEYGATIWNPHSKKLIVMIENVQRRASRQIPGLSHLAHQERLEAMNLPTLQFRRYKGDMIEMYKLSHDLYDKETISNFLNFRQSHQRT